MAIFDFFRALNGSAFKGDNADKSYIECPFPTPFVFGPGKSIGFWIANGATGTQTALTNSTGTQKIYFDQANLYVKSSAGTVYTIPKTIGSGLNLHHVIFTITSGNVLKLFFNSVESTVATLAAGEVIDFTGGVFIGKEAGGTGNLNANIDDPSFWNRETNQNESEVLYNRGFGVNCNAMPFALPASTGLAHYLPLDNLSLISKTVKDLVTGTTCFLRGGKFSYYTPNAVYFYNSSDYIVASDTTDWDINVLDTAANLTLTFIISSDIAFNYPGTGLNYAVILAFGTANESNVFRVALGQVTSSGGELFSLVSVSSTKTGVNVYHPTGGQPTSFAAGTYDIISINLSSAGTKFFRNGVKVFTNTGFSAPIGAMSTTQMRLGKSTIGGSDFTGFQREVSIITKAMTETEIINMHKSYLGLDVSATPNGLPSDTLRTTAFDLIDNGGLTIADVFAYWKGNRVNGSGADDLEGLILKDKSGNNRNMNLTGYVFPVNPSTPRRGNKLL